jgi:iron complex transport system substrate-binding protein
MRICSLLPSATETLYALGAGSQVAGVTFECDFPPEASSKRVVVRTRLRSSLNAAEIDRQVNEFVARGESLYEVDGEAIEAIQPDLIITQDLCHVCAASPGDLASSLQALPHAPEILSLNPQSLADVWNDIEKIGDAARCGRQARRLVQELKDRTAAVERAAALSPAWPRVACLEWLDPPFAAGHWVPEMVACAGGADVLGRAAKPGYRTTWEAVLKAKPEVIFIMPCGYDLRHAMEEFSRMDLPDGWEALPAARDERVFVVDASGYFSRPGPRLAGGVEILAGVIHPNHAPVPPPPSSVEKVARRTLSPRS